MLFSCASSAGLKCEKFVHQSVIRHSSRVSQAAVSFVGHGFDESDVSAQGLLGVNFGCFAAAKMNVENSQESLRADFDDLRGALDDLAFGRRRLLAKSDERVAEKRHKSGDGRVHEAEQNAISRRNGQHSLAQANKTGAQFALDLQFMETYGNFERWKKIVAVDHAMTGLHIEQFDGKNIGRSAQFLLRENVGQLESFALPPGKRLVKSFELGGASALQQAKNVQVGMVFAIFSGDRRAVENERVEVIAGRAKQTFPKLFEKIFH